MKKFIGKVLIFIILLSVGASFLDYAISVGLRNMQDYRFQVWNDIVKSKINADVVINGNSRALSHFVPTIFDSSWQCNTYNLGIGGYPFDVQYMKYNFYLKHNKRPKIIIQNVDFSTLASSSFIGHEREQVFPFIYDSYMRFHLPKFGFANIDVYFPLARYFGYQMVIKNGLFEFFHIKHYNNRPSYKGFYPENGQWNPTKLNQLKFIEFTKDSITTKLFEKYLQDCAKNGICVLLVNSPVYYKAMQKLKNREFMSNYFDSLANVNRFAYLDYSNDAICYDSINFVVAVHLNKYGADIFSKKLANDIDSLGIIENFSK